MLFPPLNLVFVITSESISSRHIILVGTFNIFDPTYLGFQIGETLQFLHDTAQKMYFNLYFEGILLKETLTMKIFYLDLPQISPVTIPFF
jgi:hypothetical protein